MLRAMTATGAFCFYVRDGLGRVFAKGFAKFQLLRDPGWIERSSVSPECLDVVVFTDLVVS